MNSKPLTIAQWGETQIQPGEIRDLDLRFSESYSGMGVAIPIQVRRGLEPGPTIFVSAAVHGDEINGTGAIRQLIMDRSLQLTRGGLILIPVVNVLGFERHSRYLPDRRDLNRSFPGNPKGSLTSRFANFFFEQIVGRSDFGIDLHTASIRKTNFPNVRADLSDTRLREVTNAFGCTLTINEGGPSGSLRRSACEADCPTFILEAGEVWKVESTVTEHAVRGIRNVLISKGMIEGDMIDPPYRTVIEKTKWVRAESSGFLDFHVAPGDIVTASTAIATTSSLLGKSREVIESPEDGVVLGMTTIPVASPGEPVCHLGLVNLHENQIHEAVENLPADGLQQRIRDDLSTSISIVDPDPVDDEVRPEDEE
ncbi:succinylglutamate desuccinylase/aspartoacylase family protein [Thalassoglobus sp. JC818]|uniref:succinylglutamate desuccinylase/aspartoacylase family protein n=1 Tax=Thalassoglobus sp. JC818 TaxID=3232136 RepID=UPI0034578F0D